MYVLLVFYSCQIKFVYSFFKIGPVTWLYKIIVIYCKSPKILYILHLIFFIFNQLSRLCSEEKQYSSFPGLIFFTWTLTLFPHKLSKSLSHQWFFFFPHIFILLSKLLLRQILSSLKVILTHCFYSSVHVNRKILLRRICNNYSTT